VSKQPERTEKDCLNCGEIVNGRFCHKCGQENIVWKQSFISLVKHFIYDLFHFDGKFFDTLKNLFIRPGLVPKEYINGKRTKYLDPIRMYLFTSAIFFIIFFYVSSKGTLLNISDASSGITNEKRYEIAQEYLELFEKNGGKDSFLLAKVSLLRDTTRSFNAPEMLVPEIGIGSKRYNSIQEYDSIQKTLPKEQKDSWLNSMIKRKEIDINTKYRDNKRSVFRTFLNDFIHKFPYMLFISLPFFAGLLKLMYSRRKNFFYSDHAIFTIYHYIISFILLLFLIAFSALRNISGWSIFNFLVLGIVFWWFIYLYKSMRRFYEQRRAKTIFKFILLNATGFILFFILFSLFFIVSLYQL
jgi:hypothetical protein